MFSKSDHAHIKQIEVDLDKPKDQDPPSPTFGGYVVKVPEIKEPVVKKQQKKEQKKQQKDLVNTAGKVGKSHHAFFKVANQTKAGNQQQMITLQELSRHKTLQSAWLSLNGVVYDVTVYMKHHPGGVILLQGCGKECFDLFNAHHPWVNAKYLLEKFKLGYLAR